jgi:uncharacterized protein involved in exopolysaccharide biosynthesis
MSESKEKESRLEQDDRTSGDRLVYVLPDQAFGRTDDEISLLKLWNILWRGKWVIIAVTASFAVGSVLFALAQERWYRAEVLLAPTDAKSVPSFGGQLGGLAALAGVTVGGEGSAEALATLESREFARAFINDFNLVHVFFAEDWDADRGEWRDRDSLKWPDVRDAVKFFHDNVLKVSEDRQTLLVTVAVEWTDPDLAAEWARAIVRRLNARLRERALLEAEANVAFLQTELAQTNVVTLQQSIGRLLESELQKLMLARGNEEFAFRVIDAAEPPKKPSRPRRSLMAILGTALGGMIGVFGVLLMHAVKPKIN